MNVPMAYFLNSGRPSKATEPKTPLLPPRPFLEAYHLHAVPVDVCANHHIAALVLCMTHPDRLQFQGTGIKVFNSSNDTKDFKEPGRVFSEGFLSFLRFFTHWDEKDFDFPNRRGLRLLRDAAKQIGGTEGSRLRKD